MESVSRVIKATLPNYLSDLPIPDSIGGIFHLSVKDWIRLIPFAGAISFFAWVTYTRFIPSKKKDIGIVNPDIGKDCDKVVHSFDIEDLGKRASFCRCWRSSKFPFCDGSHNAFNVATGDNVGPLVLKHKEA